jgi:hypothetical protein
MRALPDGGALLELRAADNPGVDPRALDGVLRLAAPEGEELDGVPPGLPLFDRVALALLLRETAALLARWVEARPDSDPAPFAAWRVRLESVREAATRSLAELFVAEPDIFAALARGPGIGSMLSPARGRAER